MTPTEVKFDDDCKLWKVYRGGVFVFAAPKSLAAVAYLQRIGVFPDGSKRRETVRRPGD